MKSMFVNLPVTDLERAKAFYEALGFSINPKFTDHNAACVVVEDGHNYFMILVREFFQAFLQPSSKLLQWVSYLVTVVASVGILVSIYNSVSARMREIAILRALGATRARILTLICLEAGFIGLAGSLMGLLAGHLLGAAGSGFIRRLVGEGFNWVAIGNNEVIYLAAVVGLAILAGLVPAMKAYKVPVATNLVAG
jgi:ABC-type antimicrobial peptide transport system permease subunit